jgi:hypothetical protein
VIVLIHSLDPRKITLDPRKIGGIWVLAALKRTATNRLNAAEYLPSRINGWGNTQYRPRR